MNAREGLLSSVLRSREAAIEAQSMVRPDMLSGHGEVVLREAYSILSQGARPDKETVISNLKSRDNLTQECEKFIEEVSSFRVSPRNVAQFCRVVQEDHIKESLLSACEEVARRLVDTKASVKDVQEYAERKILSISTLAGSSTMRHIAEVMKSAENYVEMARERGGVVGVPTGLKRLDKMIGGLQGKKLYIVAARPSQGKSALCGTCVQNGAEKGHGSAVFSLEMAGEEYGLRGTSRKAGLSSHDLSLGRISEEEADQFRAASKRMAELPIWIDDEPGLRISELKGRARRLVHMHGVEAVWIDYAQLAKASGSFGSREEEKAEISKALKGLAKELDIPVVALLQLNRGVENRGGDMRPRLSDIRESGQFEQDADVVIFVHRPEQYGIQRYKDGTSTEGRAELIVAKQRGGPTGTAEVAFVKKHASFENLAPTEMVF